jgi:hypothetical protein
MAKIPVNSAPKMPAPKPGKATVYIDVEDEITSIIDKVDGATAKLVALVLPKRTSSLQSVVNMRLLKRSADSAGKTVVLITKEAPLLPLAGAAGLHVAGDLQSKPEVPPSPLERVAEESSRPMTPDVEGDEEDEDIDSDKPAKIDYNRSIGELAAAHEVEEPEVISLDDDSELPEPKTPKSSAPKQAKTGKLKVPNFEKFRLLLFGGIAAFIALIIFLFMAIFVLPKATVTIQTNSSPISANLTLNASDKYTTLNEAANQIPALLKASDQTAQQTANATGQQNQGNKAGGTVTISNCTNNAVTIPAGTGVSTGGLTYITQKSLALDSGNFTLGGVCKTTGSHIGSVDVLATQGGTKYNIPSGQSFAVSNEPSGVTGKNSAPFTGGTDNNVTVVSQGDVDAARAKVTSQSADDYTNNFLKQLDSSGFYVLRSTLKVGDPQVTASPAVGQQASSTSVSIKITYTVMVVQKSDLTKIIADTLNDQIDKSRQKISSGDVLKDASITVQNQTAPAVATLNVSETTTAVPIIDVSAVKKLAVGKKKADIQTPISNWPGVKNVDVHMSPFWVSKAPKNQAKIKVILQQVKE